MKCFRNSLHRKSAFQADLGSHLLSFGWPAHGSFSCTERFTAICAVLADFDWDRGSFVAVACDVKYVFEVEANFIWFIACFL